VVGAGRAAVGHDTRGLVIGSIGRCLIHRAVSVDGLTIRS
jgi:hypothetical protein